MEAMLKLSFVILFSLFVVSLPYVVSLDHHGAPCPIAVLLGQTCPDDPLQDSAFHVGGMVSLMTSVFQESGFVLLAFAALAFFAFLPPLLESNQKRTSLASQVLDPPKETNALLFAKQKGILERKEDPTRV